MMLPGVAGITGSAAAELARATNAMRQTWGIGCGSPVTVSAAQRPVFITVIPQNPATRRVGFSIKCDGTQARRGASREILVGSYQVVTPGTAYFHMLPCEKKTM